MMTKEEYMEFHRQCCEKMIAVTKAKNTDYTGTSGDPFANFSRVEEVGICSTEQGFLTDKTLPGEAFRSQPNGGQLNPTWVEWLMGYPLEWTALEDWVTPWFRPKRVKRLKD